MLTAATVSELHKIAVISNIYMIEIETGEGFDK